MKNYSKKYINPSVKVLDSTNIPGYHYWMESRANITSVKDGKLVIGSEVIENEQDYYDRIRKMSLQYNNFDFLIFEIDGSVLFRDILYNINKTAQWAVSLRFVHSVFSDFDPENYAISSEYKDLPEWESQMNTFLAGVQKDSKTDNNRLQMPYSVHSKYWVGMNLKTLMAFLTMLKREMPFFYDTYGVLFEEAYKKRTDQDLTKWMKDVEDPSIYQYFDSNIDSFEPEYFEKDGIVILKQEMGPLLFSQFIRQSDVIVKGFYDTLRHSRSQIDYFKNQVFSSQTPLKVTYIASKEKWMRTISNRTCWFSMSQRGEGTSGYLNSWSNVLDIVLESTKSLEDFKDLLPCSWTKDHKCISCPYFDDVKFRMEGFERENPPCALAINDPKIARERFDHDKTILSRSYNLLAIEQYKNHEEYSVYNEIVEGNIDPFGTRKKDVPKTSDESKIDYLEKSSQPKDFDIFKFIEGIK